MNHESPEPWSQTVHDGSMVVTSSGDDFTTNFLELDYPVFDDTSGLEDGQAGHDTPMGDLGMEQLGVNGSMGDGTTARTQHGEMPMAPSYPYMKSADAISSDMHPQLLHHQHDHGHIIQNQNFHPQYTIPLTPHSCSEIHGTAGTYQRLMDMQSQVVYDRGHVSWTPLVSPAFSIPEYTVPGEYFSPLTSPIIRPQPRRQNTYPSAPSPDTGPTNSPIDPHLDTSKAAGASHSVAKKAGRRSSASSRTPTRSARQSPLWKSQGRRRPNSLNASSASIVRMASSNDTGTRPAPLGHKPVSSSDGSGPDSVSPEPLTDILMPPPSIPRSAGRSPNIQADGKSPDNAPATPFTILRRQGKGQTQFSPRTDQDMGVPAVEDGDFMLPEAATSTRPTLGIDTSKVNDVDQSAPPLSAKTPKLSANSTPRHTLMSPDILSPSTSISQKLGDSKAASRNAKKRQSTSSAQISPMLVPKISPSIKPLIPSSGSGGPAISADASARYLASKSNYQNILEGTHLPGVSYPEALAENLSSKRTSHKIAEQGRRNRINTALKEIEALLPPSQVINGKKERRCSNDGEDGEKPSSMGQGNSKASTVELAIVYIRSLQKDLAETQSRLEVAEKKLAEGNSSSSQTSD